MAAYLNCLLDALMTVSVLWLFLVVPLVSMQCVIVVFLNHTQLLFH